MRKVGIILALAGCAVMWSAPAVRLSPGILNLGAVRAGSVTAARTWICNDGDSVLTINRLFSSCGCTGASTECDTVAPGDSTLMTVTFDTRGRLPGTVHKTVRVTTNAGSRLLQVKTEILN